MKLWHKFIMNQDPKSRVFGVTVMDMDRVVHDLYGLVTDNSYLPQHKLSSDFYEIRSTISTNLLYKKQ